jgi:hypothetical protein
LRIVASSSTMGMVKSSDMAGLDIEPAEHSRRCTVPFKVNEQTWVIVRSNYRYWYNLIVSIPSYRNNRPLRCAWSA